ncbi:E3 ubiquitin-protein ligase Mdm2 [Centroberyx gerrardi]
MSADSDLNTDTTEDNKLVRPKLEFQSLLQHAGATKEVFTMKEVMFYLGQYIIQKQLYDQRQQHIVHCSQDALGRVLGVDSFSVKEPRVLFAMITKNLVAVKTDSPPGFTEQHSQSDRGTEEADSESRSSSPERKRRRRRRSRRSSGDPGPSHSVEDDEDEEEEEEEEEGRKRRRSDSFSLTFDNSLSWCVIGGLGSGRDRHSSQSSDAHSTSGRSEVSAAASESDSDNFSVEFEVESIDSDDYDDDEASLSGEDQVYEVTIFEADADNSSDEDTEITEADYWRCVKCEELNPPLPRNCNRCWALRQDWLPEVPDKISPAPSSPKALPLKPTDQSEAAGADAEENEGVDVPDGKRAKTPLLLSQCLSDSSAPNSQDRLPPSSSSTQDLLPPSSSSTQDLLPPSSSSTQDLLPPSSSSTQDLLLPPSSSSSAPNSQDPLPPFSPSTQDLLLLPSQPPCSSPEKLWTPDLLPPSLPPSSSSSSIISSSPKPDSQELLPSSPSPLPSPSSAPPPPPPPVPVPELERSVSAECRLPDSCLDPCLICQSRPKNGCIVHGRTGHLMSCYVCARKLKRRNKLCPVCRLPIQSVVLTYIS